MDFLLLLIKKALEISNKYDKKLFCTHIYLKIDQIKILVYHYLKK